ncbi:hypothetical protein MARPO_0024s0027 [Marchantia polymorpha]|uniref:Uncharacterized protein n=1 Tax=Marchantia polymorpha TaxID=3197 RepID=A0A2R6XBL2_MARPO|nr:hypothetical protein MARPO_0024s0027 [Marchantia polymorpha]|eukprot:PTQ43508.1 hypothetical protein MARPO_0024s0027 [Marchantia polymorpha]
MDDAASKFAEAFKQEGRKQDVLDSELENQAQLANKDMDESFVDSEMPDCLAGEAEKLKRDAFIDGTNTPVTGSCSDATIAASKFAEAFKQEGRKQDVLDSELENQAQSANKDMDESFVDSEMPDCLAGEAEKIKRDAFSDGTNTPVTGSCSDATLAASKFAEAFKQEGRKQDVLDSELENQAQSANKDMDETCVDSEMPDCLVGEAEKIKRDAFIDGTNTPVTGSCSDATIAASKFAEAFKQEGRKQDVLDSELENQAQSANKDMDESFVDSEMPDCLAGEAEKIKRDAFSDGTNTPVTGSCSDATLAASKFAEAFKQEGRKQDVLDSELENQAQSANKDMDESFVDSEMPDCLAGEAEKIKRDAFSDGTNTPVTGSCSDATLRCKQRRFHSTKHFLVYKGALQKQLQEIWSKRDRSQEFKILSVEHLTPEPDLDIEVLIAGSQATSFNPGVIRLDLWGTDIYTDDSDIVAVLKHTGFYDLQSSTSDVFSLRASIRLLPPLPSYVGTTRNHIRSRRWGGGSTCSFIVVCCHIETLNLNDTFSVERSLEPTNRIGNYGPTLVPTSGGIPETSRRSALNLQQASVIFRYDLSNEPCDAYTMAYVADKYNDVEKVKVQFTSARISQGEVLYVETLANRYELSYEVDSSTKISKYSSELENEGRTSAQVKASSENPCQTSHDRKLDVHLPRNKYRWARCKLHLPLNNMRSEGVPLPLHLKQVVESNLNWEDFRWSPTGVWVRNKEYLLKTARFVTVTESAEKSMLQT